LANAIEKIENEARFWAIDDDKVSLLCLGTMLADFGFNVIAFAVFLVLEERPKITALMLVDDKLRSEAVAFAEQHANSRYADVVRKCQS